MSYLVLARKFRPQNFDEVVGQAAVVRTLQNALTRDRVPHALIFSGVRGVGKTTLARIMAKTLNCEKGPAPSACNSCRSCREIMAGTSVDLHEIDGASNRGIQEIRELKEKIRFMPTGSRFKIIIIDEVHMLTTEAFNALLKTLEEPPAHVYFMFATTELHRLPVTILSRCQRYELKRVSHRDLAAHLAKLAQHENIAIEPAALNLIVREAGGSVRDGLSLLDQIFSYCGQSVSTDDVIEVLGLVSHRAISDIGVALLAGNAAESLEHLNRIYGFGMDLKRFINDLLAWFRALMVCKSVRQPGELLDLPDEDIEALRETAAAHSAEKLFQIFNCLLENLEKSTYSGQPRFLLEMALVKAAQLGDITPVSKIIGQLDKLLAGIPLDEQRNTPAGHAPPVTPPRTAPVHGPGPGVSPVSPPAATPVATPAATPTAKPRAATFSGPTDGAPLAYTQKTSDPGANDYRASTTPPQSAAGRQPEPPPTTAQDLQPDPPPTTAQNRAADNPSTSGAATPSFHSTKKKDVRLHWQDFISYVKERKTWMVAALQRASGVRLENDVMVITYKDSADCGLLKNQDNINLLTEFALDFFQETFRIKVKVPSSGGGETDNDGANGPQQERRDLANDPLVLTALEIFNGQIGDIRIGPRFRKPLAETEAQTTSSTARPPNHERTLRLE